MTRRGSGSSPLTRGKPSSVRVATQPCGLIPAHAGKTTLSRVSSRGGRAHPRSRGENRAPARPSASTRGSSPLTRGKRPRQHAAGAPDGLIPAHAGKTARLAGFSALAGAHPRSRGENAYGQHLVEGSGGSSPLTRGKPKPVTGSWAAVGLIPAHAGKTSYARRPGACPSAHPRSRGENARKRTSSSSR